MTHEFPLEERYALPCPSLHDESTDRVQLNPGLNHVVIPPSQQDALGEAVGVLQFPVLYASRHLQTSAGAALGQLARGQTNALFSVLSGDRQSIERLAHFERACAQVHAEFAPIARTATRVVLRELWNDEALVDRFVTAYADNSPSLNHEQVRAAFESLQKATEPPDPVPIIAERLRNLQAKHGFVALESVVDVTLAPPELRVSPVAAVDAPSHCCPDLIERATLVLDVIDDIDDSVLSAHEFDRAELHMAVDGGEYSGDFHVSKNRRRFPSDIKIPPIQYAPEAETVDSTSIGLDNVGYPSGLGWLIARIFHDAGVGAVLYRRHSGHLNWMVNPYVAETTDEEGEPLTYAQRWERAVFADRVLDQVYARVDDTNRRVTAIECPLCALSVECCGASGCTFASTLTTVNEQLHELVAALRDASQWGDRNRW
jgi:hypothetical protein